MSNSDPLDPENLEVSGKDIVLSGIKGGVSSVPLVGSFLNEIVGIVVESPIENRTKKFLLALRDELYQLKNEKRIVLTKLKENDEFVDIVIQASELAIKNSQEEKLDLLKNAVINTALGIDIERDEKMICLDVISRITPSHYKILKMCYDSESYLTKLVNEADYKRKQGRECNIVLFDDFNKILGFDDSFFRELLSNLETLNLLRNTAGSHTAGFPSITPTEFVKSLESTVNERRTSFGHKFIKFVSENNTL